MREIDGIGKIIQLNQQGVKLTEIAKTIGISYPTV